MQQTKIQNHRDVEQEQSSISVVIPFLHAHQNLDEAVKSVLAQTLPPLEVIVVNGVLDRDLPQGLSRFGKRIRIVSCPPHATRSLARNIGARAARGNLLAFNDSTGLWHPQKLEKQVLWLQMHPECSLVHTGCTLLVNGSEVSYVDKPPRLTTRDMLKASHVLINSVLLRSELMAASEGFDASFARSEGFEFTFRLLDQGYRLDFLPEPLVFLKPDPLTQGSTRWQDYFVSHARVVWRNRKYYRQHAGFLGTWQHVVKYLEAAGGKQGGPTGKLLRIVAKILYPFPIRF